MKTAETLGQWLDTRQTLSLSEWAECSGLTLIEIHYLIDNGVLEPLDRQVEECRLSAHQLPAARSAARLRSDFDLTPAALGVALTLLHRVQDLEREMRALRARAPRLPDD